MARLETNGGAGGGVETRVEPQRDASAASASFLQGGNGAYLENLLSAYEADPASVGADWRAFFAELGVTPRPGDGAAPRASWAREDWPRVPKSDWVSALDGDWAAPKAAKDAPATAPRPNGAAVAAPSPPLGEELQRATRDSVRALMMIRAYRMRGHLHANLDPLGLEQRHDHGELHPATYGFEDKDYDRKIFIDGVLGMKYASVFEMVTILRRTYCGSIGFEFMHVLDPKEKAWLQARIEGPKKEIVFTREGKRAILRKLVEAEGFEKFLDVKYTGTKRFGLDGAESIVPALEQIIKRGGALGVREIVLGMAHRGRLNICAR